MGSTSVVKGGSESKLGFEVEGRAGSRGLRKWDYAVAYRG